MNQFVLDHSRNDDQYLRLFPHISEIGAIKNTSIRLDGFPCIPATDFAVYCIQDGKFEWTVADVSFQVYPGDVVIVLPGIEFGNFNSVLEIGSFFWIKLKGHYSQHTDKWKPGEWSRLTNEASGQVCDIIHSASPPVLQKCNEAGLILKNIQAELTAQSVGYSAKVNGLIDELLILIARQFTSISSPGRNFPKTFMELEQQLRKDLSHQWTVEEMAALIGMGTTLFNERVKSYSGFSPLSYLINIRISEAIKLLKDPAISLTDIALDTGFYSSQHFSTTFKKLTGYTPSQFRKNHITGK